MFFGPNSLSESVAAVCSAAEKLKRSGQPPITLFWFSGNKKFRNELTESVLVGELRAHPELVDSWRSFSADKRYSPAWYFDEKSPGTWMVGYYHEDNSKRVEVTYTDQTVACANFILREMGA